MLRLQSFKYNESKKCLPPFPKYNVTVQQRPVMYLLKSCFSNAARRHRGYGVPSSLMYTVQRALLRPLDQPSLMSDTSSQIDTF